MAEPTILIVDDEPANVRLLERILTQAKYTSTVSTNFSGDVLRLVREHDPDLILLDLHMPPPDGFALLALLAESTSPGAFRPVLVLTADITSKAKLRALAAGAHDFLTKPFDRAEVVLRVGNLLRTRQLHRQVQSHNRTLEETVAKRTGELQAALYQLESTQKQVVQQERLRALGLMASGVAHDFNNALSVILGFSEILLMDARELPGGEAFTGHLQTIITAALDGAEMVTRLREFHRPAGLVGEPRVSVDLNDLATQCVTLTQPRWNAQALQEKKVITVRTELGIASTIAGDPAELREALTNLIFNAVDAMSQGGVITLRTTELDGWVTIEVADTGVGMTEEVRRQCLEPFFSTKGERGTGLGLAMVYGIVDRHGGTLEIVSAVGEGTTFRLRFPRGEGSEAAETESLHMERLLRILVADDQPVLCDILAEYLEHDWHTVVIAHSGPEALEKFRTEPCDLVITDQAMPGLAGDELAAIVKAEHPGTRVILLTGFGEAGAAAPPHVDLVLAKPTTLVDLRRGIVRVMMGESA